MVYTATSTAAIPTSITPAAITTTPAATSTNTTIKGVASSSSGAQFSFTNSCGVTNFWTAFKSVPYTAVVGENTCANSWSMDTSNTGFVIDSNYNNLPMAKCATIRPFYPV